MRLLDSKLFLVIGMGAAKICPILFGLYLSRRFGEGTYAAFVLLLNYAAATTAFASMGATPRILRASATDDPTQSVVNASFSALLVIFSILVIGAVYWSCWSSSSFFGTIDVSIGHEVFLTSLYSLGIAFISLIIPVFSYLYKWGLAGFCGVIIYSLAMLLGMITGQLVDDSMLSITIYVLAFLVASVIIFFYVHCNFYSNWKMIVLGFSFKRLGRTILDNITASFFGVIYLCGFFFINSQINHNSTTQDAAFYSLLFQCFSVIIFVPGVLGGIVIPMISNKAASAEKKRKIFLTSLAVYLTISLAVAFGFVIIFPFVSYLFGVEINSQAQSTILFFMFASVLASCAAVYIQRLGADGSFGVLFGVSVVWLFALVGILKAVGDNAFAASVALCSAYGIALFCYVVFYIFKLVLIKKISSEAL